MFSLGLHYLCPIHGKKQTIQMEIKKFKKLNNIVAVAVLAVASFTYLSTIEPTVSFWDCGEFIASSYKLEVGHPPGNPTFQVLARFFTIFTDKEHAAMMVNAMSALCSALTIMLLYLTIVHLARRLMEKKGVLASAEGIDAGTALKILGSGVVGALAYCWSDTFWFSAVEGEVYAMSSLATALVFWAMLKWEETADEPYANRWLVFIAFIMGLSIGIHLLNLLTIPALGMLYYYRKCKISRWGAWRAFFISCFILILINWIIIPYLPSLSAFVDRIFVNGFSLPKNSGAAFFVLLVIGLCFWGAYYSYKSGKALWNNVFFCTLAIIIGYSLFAVTVIRSSANTPTNEYQPDNPYTLVRYLSREQYGSSPLIYGQTYKSRLIDVKTPSYYNYDSNKGKYVKLDGPAQPVYGDKVLFPRMWSNGADGSSYARFYTLYTGGKDPDMGSELKYFFGYQLNFMYWRYFFWNFVGRQNDLHATVPGDIYKGNWESGIGFIDRAHLGDQSEGPDYIVNSRAKNHFYFLPLILGLIGLLYQLRHDKRNTLVTFLLFFLTGIAVVLYLNQPPYQPRERDYAYAGSFYAFTIWIGFAVLWLGDVLEKIFKGKKAPAAAIASVLCLLVPVQMVSQTWDDHDRSGRYTCHDLAYNYLIGLDKNAILVTHGDNDTFPLWYIQEVEGVRTDVRIMNTSLLGTDWYIDQMKCKQYESDPVPFTLEKKDYYYGKNDFVPVTDYIKGTVSGVDLIKVLKDPSVTVRMGDGKNHNLIVSRHYTIPVNKGNVEKYGIVSAEDLAKVPDTLQFNIPDGVSSIDKTSLMMLDLLAHYNWDRPLYVLQRGGDINIGIKDYLQYDGYGFKFVPIKNKTGLSSEYIDQSVDPDVMYDRIMNTYRFESLAAPVNMDYQNLLTFNALLPVRDIMAQNAKALAQKDEPEKAIAVLDKMQKVMPAENFPLNSSLLSSGNDLAVMDAVGIYFACGEKEKGEALGDRFIDETYKHITLFSKPYDGEIFSWENLQRNIYYLIWIADTYKAAGLEKKAESIRSKADTYVKLFTGKSLDEV